MTNKQKSCARFAFVKNNSHGFSPGWSQKLNIIAQPHWWFCFWFVEWIYNSYYLLMFSHHKHMILTGLVNRKTGKNLTYVFKDHIMRYKKWENKYRNLFVRSRILSIIIIINSSKTIIYHYIIILFIIIILLPSSAQPKLQLGCD